MNYSIITNFSNVTGRVIDCGTLSYTLADKVNGTIKIITVVLFVLLFFEMWAIKRIINSAETHEKKKNLIDIIMTFMHPIMIIFVFYILYWIFISGLE
jgi:hypothetical protein